MRDKNFFCNRCKEKNQIIWFKTKDHFLDLYKGKYGQSQFENFSKELKRHGLEVNEIDSKTIEVEDIKNRIVIKINRHECGPEILLEFGKDIVVAGIVALILEEFKKILETKAKKQKEKIQYVVYVFKNNTRVELNFFDEESILKAIKGKNIDLENDIRDKDYFCSLYLQS